MNHKKTERIKVSVIIPIYNTAPYLEKAIRSIFNQTLTDLEIIAINDGSTDDSLRLLEQLQQADPRLQVYSQENKGLSITRNTGFSKVQGEFVYFFDSDDFLEKDALEQCYNTACESDCDFVCFDAIIMDSKHSEQNLQLPYQRKGVLAEKKCYSGAEALKQLEEKNKFSTSVCLHLIRTSFLKDIQLQFYPNILHEDHLYTCLLYLQANRVKYLPADYFHRRMRAQSIMTSPISMRNIQGCLTVCSELTKFDTEHPELSTLQRKLLRQEITTLVNIMASSAISLPAKTRMNILQELTTKYANKLTLASVILLFFPFLKLKKRG